jgi:tRNA(fMet)-specific endonuclease VapC
VRGRLESSGRPIGGNDYWIAAHALATERTLVTDNVREFRRVPNLAVENWFR